MNLFLEGNDLLTNRNVLLVPLLRTLINNLELSQQCLIAALLLIMLLLGTAQQVLLALIRQPPDGLGLLLPDVVQPDPGLEVLAYAVVEEGDIVLDDAELVHALEVFHRFADLHSLLLDGDNLLLLLLELLHLRLHLRIDFHLVSGPFLLGALGIGALHGIDQ